MRSYKGLSGFSKSSVTVVVNGTPRKDYVIIPMYGDEHFMFLDWNDDVELFTQDYQLQANGSVRKMVYVISHRTGGEAKPIGLLPLDCNAIPNGGRKISAHLRRSSNVVWENIFTPL